MNKEKKKAKHQANEDELSLNVKKGRANFIEKC